MVNFGLEQGLNLFETGGIATLFRGFQKCENEAPDQKVLFLAYR